MVKTKGFEGPLDTLLSMIRSRELNINDISLAQVTDDYLDYIESHAETLENKAEFVRIAATLVLAKSKTLLPNKTTDKEDEEVDNLERRLRAYRLVKDRAKQLRTNWGQTPLFTRQASPVQPDVFAPGNTLDTTKIKDSIRRCVIDLPEESLPTDTLEETVTLQEEIQRLQKHCRDDKKIPFTSVIRSQKKHHQIVSFTALLELNHQGKITARQPDHFAEIMIRSQS